MNPNAYIPIPRALFDDPIWLEKRTFSKAEAIADLYRRAAYLPHGKYVDGKLVQVGMGQVVDSLRYLANAWGWGKSSVHDFLKRLEKLGHLSLETRTGLSVITLTFSATYYAEAAEARTATGQQPDSSRTAAGQQPDKREEDKEDKEDKGGVGALPATPAPPISQFPNSPISPNDPAFELLKRIGAPAAQLWVQGQAANHFDTTHHAAIALDWMEYLCRKQRPIAAQQELSALIQQFKGKTIADLREVLQYSYQGGYTALYFDRLEKPNRKSSIVNRHNLDPQDLENSRKNAKITPSGMKLL